LQQVDVVPAPVLSRVSATRWRASSLPGVEAPVRVALLASLTRMHVVVVPILVVVVVASCRPGEGRVLAGRRGWSRPGALLVPSAYVARVPRRVSVTPGVAAMNVAVVRAAARAPAERRSAVVRPSAWSTWSACGAERSGPWPSRSPKSCGGRGRRAGNLERAVGGAPSTKLYLQSKRRRIGVMLAWLSTALWRSRATAE
jgi:hypothetical protein